MTVRCFYPECESAGQMVKEPAEATCRACLRRWLAEPSGRDPEEITLGEIERGLRDQNVVCLMVRTKGGGPVQGDVVVRQVGGSEATRSLWSDSLAGFLLAASQVRP